MAGLDPSNYSLTEDSTASALSTEADTGVSTDSTAYNAGDDYSSVIGAVIGLGSTAISAGVSSNAASQNVAAQNLANTENMGINLKSLAIEQEKADTEKRKAQQEENQKTIDNMMKKISGSPLEKRLLEIYSGK